MCGIALVWRGASLVPSTAAAGAEPAREQWEGEDESPEGAMARSGLHGAQLWALGADAAAEPAPEPEPELLLVEELAEALRRRGPDQAERVSLRLHPSAPAALCCGSTLGMQGPATAQPLRGPDGSLLLWNGEVFGGDVAVASGENDTAAVMAALASERGSTPQRVVECFASIAGPWACIFWQPSSRSLWFGHDRIGRRSLLLGHSPAGGVAIASVAPASTQDDADAWHWQELPPSGMYQLEQTESGGALGRLQHFPWPVAGCAPRQADAPPPDGIEGEPEEMQPAEPPEAAVSADRLLHALDEAVRRRVESAPDPTPLSTSGHAEGAVALSGARVAVLFSGGVDCMVVAALAHRHRPAD